MGTHVAGLDGLHELAIAIVHEKHQLRIVSPRGVRRRCQERVGQGGVGEVRKLRNIWGED